MLEAWQSEAVPESVRTTEVDPARDPPPSKLGRYVLLDELGAGGMGVVYNAWDRELERRVALKILRGDGSLREAKALAKLKHANVVTVHDVGSIDGYDFIAMELVEGASLRAWLGTPRSWRDIVSVFRGAGRGLAAAHAAGLVHRDFKPDNVLIANDGGVRVADFGLAQARDSAGGKTGTPRYMAPEQRDGAAADPTMDQYSFCVSMWEALFGDLPDGTAIDGARPATGHPPTWLRAILRRGLADDPQARFPSLDALLVELGRATPRSYVALFVAGAIVLAALIGFALRGSTEAPCAGSDRKLAGVWDADTRRAMHEAFAASRRYGADIADRVAALLDTRASAWVAMRTETCDATAVRHEQSEALLDLRMACLDERLRQLHALTEVFAHADGSVVDNAVQATVRLDDLAGCADTTSLLAVAPPPSDPVGRQRVDTLVAAADRARALTLAGRYRDAKALADTIVTDARALGDPHTLGLALEVRSFALTRLYEDKTAEADLDAAIPLLAATKDDGAVADAWIRLFNVIVIGEARLADADAYRRAGEAAIARAPSTARRTHMDYVIAVLLRMRGKFTESLVYGRSALQRQREMSPDDDPWLATCLNNIGITLRDLGRYDEALAAQVETHDMYVRLGGPDHPSSIGSLVNIAVSEQALGRDVEAERVLAEVIAREEATDPDHPDLATALQDHGETRLALGDVGGARADFSRALAIRERKFPPGHVALASSLRGLGTSLVRTGEPAAGADKLARALAIVEAKLGPTHERNAEMLVPLGEALIAEGKLDEAAAAYARAAAIFAAGPADAKGALLLADVDEARAELALRRNEPALGFATAALSLRTRYLAANHPLLVGVTRLVARAATPIPRP